MAEQTADVVVVGGGVIGCAIAYYASKAGLKVIVVESTKIGGQGSSVAAGLVAPSPQIKEDGPFARLALASLAYLPQLRDELSEDTGIDIELDERGTLKLAANDEEAQELRKLLPIKQQLGLDLQWLSANEVRQLEPGVTAAISGAIFSPKEGQIDTSKLLAAYIEGATRYSAQFARENAVKLLTHDANITGVQFPLGCIHSEHTIIASGAWAAEQGKWLGVEIPVRPQRGQIATVGTIEPELRHIIFYQKIYLAPRCNATTTLGASNDYAGYVQVPTVSGVMSLLAQGQEVVPSIANGTFIAAKAGLRAKTPDKLPIIGPIPGWNGVQVAVGHNSNGLLASAVTGRSIANALTGGKPTMDLAPFRLDRFLHGVCSR